ncbi:hypothetical protein T484DRAFT_1844399, partial [Baffinella frigidus]
ELAEQVASLEGEVSRLTGEKDTLEKTVNAYEAQLVKQGERLAALDLLQVHP